MSKPWIHSRSSAKRWGGSPEEYLDIHNFMDSHKSALADHRGRAATHNAWFISVVIERVFGGTFVNSVGRTVSTRDVAEQHVLEDYGGKFIPTLQDFLQDIPIQKWMVNGVGGYPPSYVNAKRKEEEVFNSD